MSGKSRNNHWCELCHSLKKTENHLCCSKCRFSLDGVQLKFIWPSSCDLPTEEFKMCPGCNHKEIVK